MFLRILSIAILCTVTAACNRAPTGYQSTATSARGGYSDQKIGEGVYMVSAVGNAYTDKQRLQKIVLLRAANLTRENGFSQFEVIFGTGVFANTNQEMLSPLLAYRGGGGFAFRSSPIMVRTTTMRSYPMYIGGYSVRAVLNTGSLVIRMTNGKGGIKGLPSFSAQKVISKLEPQFMAGQPEAKP